MGNNSQQNKSQSASRTDYCGQLEASDVGREVVLKGWVQRVRDLGSLVFIDLRDRTGLVQLVARNSQPELLDEAKKLRCEYVVEAEGWSTGENQRPLTGRWPPVKSKSKYPDSRF